MAGKENALLIPVSPLKYSCVLLVVTREDARLVKLSQRDPLYRGDGMFILRRSLAIVEDYYMYSVNNVWNMHNSYNRIIQNNENLFLI